VGSLCSLLSFVLPIVLPFLLAFASPNFWNTVSFYHEQPLITYDNNVYLKGIPDVKVSYEDINHDDVIDIMTFDIKSTLRGSMVVRIGLVYELLDIANIKMRGEIFYDVNNFITTCTVSTIGTLELRQREPLSLSQRKAILYPEKNIFDIIKEGKKNFGGNVRDRYVEESRTSI